MKTATNQSGATVTFDPERHSYTLDNGATLLSATTFISRYFRKFDASRMAKKCVGKPKYAGMSAEQIMAVWQEKGDRARNEGTHLHAYCEAILLGRPVRAPETERESRLFCQAAQAVMEIEEKFEFIGAEAIVFSAKLGLAGTVDVLLRSPRTGNVVILDWKQNEEIKTGNFWQKGLTPIGHLDDCDSTRYGLQMSLYEMIMWEEGYFQGAKGFDRALVHVTEDGYRLFRMPSLRKEIDDMVAQWRNKPSK